MTAIVGILNKQAVAVAADSAVTVGGGSFAVRSERLFSKKNNTDEIIDS